MTRTVEASGKSVAEATARALAKFGITSEQAKIEVIARGRKGFLGIFGGAPARVAVSQRVSASAHAEEIVGDILRLMRLSCQLHVTEEKNTLIIDIETAGSDGLLIGKGGHTLSALEYVANRMLQRGSKKSPKIILDVSGYKRRRGDFLKSKALSLAEQVKAANKQVTTEPMDAADRSVVHAVLKSDPSVETRSVGHGSVKSIIVAPAKGGSKGKGRSRSRGGQRRRRKQPSR
ncbi:MAG: RNA-binding cell elongation regulator Jag/EloR [Candidatus Eisenbacteria bacterium]|nr:RNA-binding cell elongation regulator Jag/EloR [Candidatus Eisenbacteria bacterium]